MSFLKKQGILIICSILTINSYIHGGVHSDYKPVKASSFNPLESRLNKYQEVYWFNGSDVENSNLLKVCDSVNYLGSFLEGTTSAYFKLVSKYGNDPAGMSCKDFLANSKRVRSYINEFEGKAFLISAIETTLLFNKIVFTEKARQIFSSYFIEEDISKFYSNMLLVVRSFPDLLPSYRRLAKDWQELSLSCSNVVEYHPIANIEYGPSEWSKLYNQYINKPILQAKFDRIIMLLKACEAGASHSFFVRDFAVIDSLFDKIHSNEITPHQAYIKYIDYRTNAIGLDASVHLDRAITRLASLLGAVGVEDIASIKRVISQLPENTIREFIDQQTASTSQICSFHGARCFISELLHSYISKESRQQSLLQLCSVVIPILNKATLHRNELVASGALSQNIIIDLQDTSATICSNMNAGVELLSVTIDPAGKLIVTG